MYVCPIDYQAKSCIVRSQISLYPLHVTIDVGAWCRAYGNIYFIRRRCCYYCCRRSFCNCVEWLHDIIPKCSIFLLFLIRFTWMCHHACMHAHIELYGICRCSSMAVHCSLTQIVISSITVQFFFFSCFVSFFLCNIVTRIAYSYQEMSVYKGDAHWKWWKVRKPKMGNDLPKGTFLTQHHF